MKNAVKMKLKKLLLISKTKLIFILIFLFYLFQFNTANSEIRNEFSKPYCPSLNNLYLLENHITPENVESFNIEIKNKRKFNTNLLAIKEFLKETNSPLVIEKDINIFKKKFYSEIRVKFKDGSYCKFIGTVRIHGGYLQDHIEQDNISLRVDLKEANIFNSSKFSLILISNRNYYNELFTNYLFNYLNFITPLVFATKASINGNEEYDVIFQDKDEINILTYNKRKPGPILADNKRFHKNWPLFRVRIENDLLNKKNYKLDDIIYSIDALNFIYLNNFNSDAINKVFSKQFHSYQKLSSFYSILAATGSLHGLGFGDRRYHYNQYLNFFEPILYNPETSILNDNFYDEKIEFKNSIFKGEIELIKDNLSYSIAIIENINLNEFYSLYNFKSLGISKEKIGHTINKIIENLKKIDKTNFSVIDNINKDFFLMKNVGKYRLVFHMKNNFFNSCETLLSYCNRIKLNDKEIKRLLSSQVSKIGSFKLRFIRKDLNYYKENDLKILDTNLNEIFILNKNNTFYVKNEVKLYYDRDKNTLNISGKHKNSKMLFYNNSLSNININAENICLEFNLFKLENVSLTLENNKINCEDNLHFMNSKGNIDTLNIYNVSYGDALDSDFSNLNINDVKINSSGGECIGIKNGFFSINKVELNNCGDRAVSSGENGKIKIKNLKIENSHYGLQAKDHSSIKVDELSIYNVDICLIAKRTRYDYIGGIIYITKNNYLCESKKNNIIDKYSAVKFL